jgi:hypothetical protein
MSRELLPRLLALGVLAGAIACSLLVDTSELDANCGPGMKYCEQKCVDRNEPFYGCSPAECNPCPGDHIIYTCDAGECDFVSCVHGWGCPDCSKNLFTDPDNCGTCDNSCEDGGTCAEGRCVPEGGAMDAGAGGEGGEGTNAP